ncbi:MAG: peptidyl-prolyl cis-trans isomerase [Kiritimatiellia bacterium]|nr:peptidyl-prolyl cis-trans isomerase [Kiritimatiellia bacterium]MDP6630027.1 peptidyl-prolyl cis-trans isomerase [Kiritimatiellia bacterium]
MRVKAIGRIFLVTMVLLTTATVGGSTQTNEVERMRVDGVAAYVNEHVITLSEVTVLIEPVRRQLAQTYRGEALQERLREAFDNALNTVVDRYLVLDAYEKQGGRLPDWAVDNRADEMIEDLFGGDREALMRALKLEKMTYEEWRETLERQMIVQSMRGANVDQYVQITPGRVRAYYEGHVDEFQQPAQVHVRMLVLTPEQVSGHVERKQRAEELVRRTRGGEDFGSLATQFSGGSHAADGGDWGWIDPARELRSELARLAEATATGQVSEAVKIAENFYILKAEGRREAAVASLGDVYSQIERSLRQKAIQSGYAIWVARLKEDAFVKIIPPESI